MTTKHYYRFDAATKEGKLLRSFHRAAVKAEQEAQNYARKVGAQTYYDDPNSFAGGVSAVVFTDPAKVNTNIWHYVGTQEETHERLYTPNVIVLRKERTLQPGQTIPKDSATRVYLDAPVDDGQHPRTATYLEITPRIATAPRPDRTRAVTAERWRLKLPVVSVAAFYRIVHADLESPAVPPSGTHSFTEQTPTFFLYRDRYYIGLSYPVRHDGFDEITQGEYQMAQNDLLREAREAEHKKSK